MYLFEEEISDIFKNTTTYYILLISILLFVGPISSVDASHEFSAYRMQQFDFNSASYGCRTASVNLEVRSLLTWSTARHCIITWLLDMTIDQYKLLSNKAGCVLLILPKQIQSLKEDEKTMILMLEKYMMSIDTLTPTYFTHWSPELEKIASDVNQGMTLTHEKETAVQALIKSVAANGYQLVINVNKPVATFDVQIPSVYGSLPGSGTVDSDKLPSILILAHYDTFGVAPELSLGIDNNGSGMIALLELIRIFSNLYSVPKTHGKYNLIFLLTGGGKFNFLSTKKFLDEEIDNLQNIEFVLCLESLAKSSNAINFFVSKPPKAKTPLDKFHQAFSKVTSNYDPSVNVSIKHKKINLQDAWLAWEHEHYSMRKFRAFTLSTLDSNKDVNRNTILDTKENLDQSTLIRNIELIAETLAQYIYDVDNISILSSNVKVEKSLIQTYINYISTISRNLQLTNGIKKSSFIDNINFIFTKYLKHVKTFQYIQDKREPELVLYSANSYKTQANIYNVKPIIFDLILFIFIAAYLYLIYFIISFVNFI